MGPDAPYGALGFHSYIKKPGAEQTLRFIQNTGTPLPFCARVCETSERDEQAAKVVETGAGDRSAHHRLAGWGVPYGADPPRACISGGTAGTSVRTAGGSRKFRCADSAESPTKCQRRHCGRRPLVRPRIFSSRGTPECRSAVEGLAAGAF